VTKLRPGEVTITLAATISSTCLSVSSAGSANRVEGAPQ
jgi:hypothetical protein